MWRCAYARRGHRQAAREWTELAVHPRTSPQRANGHTIHRPQMRARGASPTTEAEHQRVEAGASRLRLFGGVPEHRTAARIDRVVASAPLPGRLLPVGY